MARKKPYDLSPPSMFEAVPWEILKQICSHMSIPDMKSVRLACRKLSSFVNERLFGTVKVYFDAGGCEKLLYMVTRPSFLRLVKHLVFSGQLIITHDCGDYPWFRRYAQPGRDLVGRNHHYAAWRFRKGFRYLRERRYDLYAPLTPLGLRLLAEWVARFPCLQSITYDIGWGQKDIFKYCNHWVDTWLPRSANNSRRFHRQQFIDMLEHVNSIRKLDTIRLDNFRADWLIHVEEDANNIGVFGYVHNLSLNMAPPKLPGLQYSKEYKPQRTVRQVLALTPNLRTLSLCAPPSAHFPHKQVLHIYELLVAGRWPQLTQLQLRGIVGHLSSWEVLLSKSFKNVKVLTLHDIQVIAREAPEPIQGQVITKREQVLIDNSLRHPALRLIDFLHDDLSLEALKLDGVLADGIHKAYKVTSTDRGMQFTTAIEQYAVREGECPFQPVFETGFTGAEYKWYDVQLDEKWELVKQNINMLKWLAEYDYADSSDDSSDSSSDDSSDSD